MSVERQNSQTQNLQKEGSPRQSLQKEGSKTQSLKKEGSQSQNIQKEGSQTRQSLQKEGSQIKQSLQKEGSQTRHSLQKEGSQVRQSLQKDASQIRQSLQKDGSQIRQSLQKEGSQIRQSLQKDGSQIRQSLQKDGSQIRQSLQKDGSQIRQSVQKDGSQIRQSLQREGSQGQSLRKISSEARQSGQRESLQVEGSPRDSLQRQSPQRQSFTFNTGDSLLSQQQKKSTLKGKSRRTRPPSIHHKLIQDGVDVTPKPLNPLIFEGGQEKQLGVVDATSVKGGQTVDKEAQDMTAAKFTTQLQQQQTLMMKSTYQQSHISTQSEMSLNEINDEQTYSESQQESGDVPPAGATETVEDTGIGEVHEEEKIRQVPSHVKIVLTESATDIIFEMSSHTVEKETEEGEAALEDNDRYDFLTIGRGRNRRLIHAEVQTLPVLFKTRDTEAPRAKRKNAYSFAAIWDMHDSFEVSQQTDAVESTEAGYELSHSQSAQLLDLSMSKEEKEMADLMKNNKFLEAVTVMERLLANNNYNNQQKRFRGLIEQDIFREDLEYKYRLDLLWTFTNTTCAQRCVTTMDWNPLNDDLIAVGYGKFYFRDKATGLVLIWNIKNPVQPERTYTFDAAVTSLRFSAERCNELAVGMYDGNVEVIDVSRRDKFVMGKSRRQDSHSFEAVWQVLWYMDEDYYKGADQLMTGGQDGRISRFRRTHTVIMSCSQIMRVACPDGKIKGIETVRRCSVPGVPVTRYSAALVIVRHSADPNIYFVGTDNGVVHKCSTDYYHQHLDMFLAHDGPIYAMEFSPFCDKLFITCGEDWCVRVWCEGINEPLLELSKSMQAVEGAVWSTVHSTIIASIVGTEIYIWDIQRKVYKPQSITPSPTNSRNTVVKFSPSGRCVLVGDIDGNVHVFGLEEMPFKPFFQEDLLSQTLKRVMITKPELLKKLKQMGRFSYDKTQAKRHFR